jgi:hypothetical protein
VNDGGPAFPALHSIDGNWVKEPIDKYLGMTLRDYFAAAAMQGMCRKQWPVGVATDIADGAYEIADAMLKARES